MEDKKLQKAEKKSEKTTKFLDWILMKKPKSISLEVPRTQFDFLSETLQTA